MYSNQSLIVHNIFIILIMSPGARTFIFYIMQNTWDEVLIFPGIWTTSCIVSTNECDTRLTLV